MIELQLGENRLLVDHGDESVKTLFPDETFAYMNAWHTPGMIEQATAIGYGEDTWSWVRDHEVLHTWMAMQLGREHSLVLWDAAHGSKWHKGTKTEEQATAGVAQWLKTGRINEAADNWLIEAAKHTGLKAKTLEQQARTMLARAREKTNA